MIRYAFPARILQRFLLLASAMVWAAAGHAQQGPDALVRSVVEEVLRIVEQDPALNAGDRGSAERLIEDKIAPHFDSVRMTRLAVGRNWRQASPEQQRQLVQAFRTLLIRTYAAAFRGYRETSVDVKPVNLQPGEEDVVVRTQVRWPGAPEPLAVDYSMYRSAQGWKVYDVTVGGVSLVTTYRTTFSEQVQQGGIEGLLRTLSDPRRAQIPPELKRN